MHDVIIIGAGLAGATAALELAKSNRRVTVIEARDRIGGRGYARHFAVAGELLDFGGAWITPWQHRMRALCAEHGIALRPRTPIVERRWFRDGALHRDGPTSAVDRAAHEHAVARIAADAMLLKAGKARDEHGRDIAAVSLADYLVRIGAPLSTCDLLSAWWAVSGNAEKRRAPAAELLSSSAYSDGLTEGMADVWVETLVGGVTALATRMLEDSGASLQLTHPVETIIVNDDGVGITTEDGRLWRSRAAILATGLNPLRAIRFDPPLPQPKADAIEAGHLGRAVKVWVKARNVPVGVLATGGRSEIEWMFSERLAEDGGAALLVGFGVADEGWSPRMPADAVAATKRFFPEAEVVSVDWHDWNDDPFARGAWVATNLDAPEATVAATWRRHGPLAFASSDFAPDQAGWFEGAVTSGEAAAAEILSFLGRN
ncbi:flavin monoamine oxidase family protein [Dongia sp.]|uniref:flavin monoamine oxidase family protein n=1 Tax=Dongia sp. TaxID=1977262 RepID=UPI0037528F09